MNTGWWEIDIHSCYSLVKIAFAPICACKNNRQIWRHNASASRSCDVTDQLWWRHNVKSEKTFLSDNGEMSDRWLFVAEQCVQDKKLRVRNKIIHSLPWITIFGHSWGDLPLIFTRDFVTRENHWQITPIVTKKSLFTVTHALFFISLPDKELGTYPRGRTSRRVPPDRYRTDTRYSPPIREC